jgi:cytochrome c oxidase subunit 2
MNNLYLYSSYFYNCDFQTPATPISEGILHFHHDLMVLLTFICFFVLWMLSRTLILFNYSEESRLVLNRGAYSFNYFKHQGMVLEIIWTLIPAIILMFVAIPSFALLYSSSTFCSPEATFKIIGHQWFWSYEINDGENKSINALAEDSYMFSVNKEKDSVYPRNLLTDKLLAMPTEVYIRLIITSDDVLHCWTVPAFGIKVDACPGRLNSVNAIIKREGLFFGQCSEICGVNHAFMPIGVYAISIENWLFYRLL